MKKNGDDGVGGAVTDGVEGEDSTTAFPGISVFVSVEDVLDDDEIQMMQQQRQRTRV